MAPDSYPHVYIGKDSHDGLLKDKPCRVIGKRAGGYRIIVPYDRRVFIVAKANVNTKPKEK